MMANCSTVLEQRPGMQQNLDSLPFCVGRVQGSN